MNRTSRWNRILGAAGLSLVLATPALAQTNADDQKVQNVIDQKAESDVAAAILEADKLPRDKAIQRLKQAITSLDSSITGSAKRQELLARLQNKVATYEGRATIVLPPAEAAKAKADAKAAMEKARLETDEVTKGLRKVQEALEAGHQADASKLIADLSAKFPGNPALQALRGQNLTISNLAAWNRIQAEFAQAWVADARSIMSSTIPVDDDIKFPNADKWKRITELRRDANRIKLSEKEEKILESLNTAVTVILKDRPFQEALQEFSNQIKQEIFLDTKSLEDAGLDLNRRTNFSGNVSARTALRALLQPQGLTFVVKDEMIQVVTLEKAERDMLTTRSYDVSDLVDGGGLFSNAVQWGPQLAYQQTMQNAEAIVNLIKESIDPRAWKDKGGFSSIQFHLATKSIVVRASTEVHAALGGSIKK